MTATDSPTIGQCVWEQSHPESTYMPAGGVVVDILAAYTDFDSGEQVPRRLVCLHYHRGRVQTHVLAEDRLSDLVEPLNVATLRNLYRAIYRELGAHKGQENTHNLALHGWAHRLFSIANEGVA